MVTKLSQLYLDTRRALLAQETTEEAAYMARQLLCRLTGKSPAEFLTDGEKYVSDEIIEGAKEGTQRLIAGEPLAYVLEEWEFYGLPLYVDRRVLIPRDDTVAVAELAIQNAPSLGEKPRVLDLCTGSGCIGLAIAAHVPRARVTLADLSTDALAVAKKNIFRCGLSARVTAVQADVLKAPEPFLGQFDLLVSNPPYVTTEEMNNLPHSVGDFEPSMALWGGDDGLLFYRAILRHYASILKPGGLICLEFGQGQGDAVCQLLTNHCFEILEQTRDYNQRERAVLARKPRKED